VGYELSFTKYFYKPVQLRTLDEIMNDMHILETETKGLWEEILKWVKLGQRRCPNYN